MQWVAEHINVVCVCMLDEVVGVVGIVAINKEQTALTICFSAGLVIKLLDPFDTNFTISVPLFLVAKSRKCVLANRFCDIRETYEAFKGFSCFQLA
jgi:hypothetical protein